MGLILCWLLSGPRCLLSAPPLPLLTLIGHGCQCGAPSGGGPSPAVSRLPPLAKIYRADLAGQLLVECTVLHGFMWFLLLQLPC